VTLPPHHGSGHASIAITAAFAATGNDAGSLAAECFLLVLGNYLKEFILLKAGCKRNGMRPRYE